MAKKPMTKTQIVAQMSETMQVPKKQATAWFKSIADLAAKETKRTGQFIIPGIGKLVKAQRKARKGHNPRTGKQIRIPKTTMVKFRVAKACLDTVVENPTETKALQVPEPPPIRPEEPTGEGDVGERVATLGHSFASESVMHHYHLSTHHVFQMPRSDVRSETLAALQSIIEVATSGQAVPLPGFPNHSLSIRNTWVGAVGWLIQGPERRVMVQCVTAWTIEGAAKGVRWLGTELPEELDLPCCLVKLGLPLLKEPDSASWLEDAERCISWAMLPTPVLCQNSALLK